MIGLSFITALQELVDNSGGNQFFYTLINGTLQGLGKMPAADFRVTESGTSMFRGCVRVSEKVGKKEFTQNIVVVAWGDVAEDLIDAQEGDNIAILGKYEVRKYNNNYYPQVNIIKAEILP